MSDKADAIHYALRGLSGAERWLGRREVRELPHILWDGELPERIIQGYYETGHGILVATNHRLVFVERGLLWGLRVEDFPYGRIDSIEYSTGLVFGELTIYASGNLATISHVVRDRLRDFAEYVRARIGAMHPHHGAAGTAARPLPAPVGLMEQLERLSDLRTRGLLDEPEFKAAKAKLLGL